VAGQLTDGCLTPLDSLKVGFLTSTSWEAQRLEGPMRRVEEYRQFAEDCRQLARTLRKPEHRQQLQEMATAWEMLALEREAQLAKDKRSDAA